MRWYDLNPDVSMAISMIECSSEAEQIEYAQFIIDIIKEKDKSLTYLQNTTQERLNRDYNRWYDENDIVSRAFEYLKGTSDNLQEDVSRSVLTLINNSTAV